MPRIEVEGIVHTPRWDPMKQMQDMLRYDEGEVERVDREGKKFTAIVQVRKYTPERWHSFGLRTRKV